MEVIAERNAFLTLKDHKPNFASKPTVRLINPARDEIGVVSKHLLTSRNQRRCTRTHQSPAMAKHPASPKLVQEPPHRQNRKFVKFDIVNFYPSITEELLEKAIDHASQYTDISEEEKKIIRHARHSILFSHGATWQKKENPDFDVTMGSYDGAEVCELVGLFLLSLLEEKFGKNEVGLYRDDGLGAKASSARQADRLRKEITKIFKDNGLEITVEILLPQTDFLDTVLDLPSGKHWPYRKPNNVPLYIHKQSNHPPVILKNLPAAINKRVSALSCDSEVFEAAKPEYEEALRKSGFSEKMNFIEPDQTPAPQTENKRKRKRKVIWYNPPFNANVKTNVAEEFLRIIDSCIPKEYRKLFNRNNVKVSYCTMPNMAEIVQSHNARVLAPPEIPPAQTCNCTPRYIQQHGPCPLNGVCLTECLVYKATVSVPQRRDMHYIGLAGHTFKERHYGHTSDFRNKRTATGLSRYIWQLKDEGLERNVTWKIHKKAHPYRCGSRRCDLCLSEKLAIARADPVTSLNKRSELAKACNHQYKWKYDKVSGAPV